MSLLGTLVHADKVRRNKWAIKMPKTRRARGAAERNGSEPLKPYLLKIWKAI